MQGILQQTCWRAISQNIIAVSAENILQSGYDGYCPKPGQFCLQQPFQRSSRANHLVTEDSADRVGQKRKRDTNEESINSDGKAKVCLQLQVDMQTIFHSHQQLLQLLDCHARPTAAPCGNSPTQEDISAAPAAEQKSHTAPDAVAVALELPEPPAAGVAAADHAAPPPEAANTQFTACITRVSDQITAHDDSSTSKTAATSTDSTDWLALAEMRHVLKPKITFSYTPIPETNMVACQQQTANTHHHQQQQTTSNLFNCVVTNPSASEVVATAYEQVLLPAKSTFCMSDMKDMQPFVQAVRQAGGSSLLVVDPPWENASARRSAKYKTLTPNHLLWLPVKQLLRQDSGTLVALWMTNRPRLHNFVREKLLPAWGLQHVATWFWLKVAATGEPVTPLGSLHRQPYEQLWLARVVAADSEALAADPLKDASCSDTATACEGGQQQQQSEQQQQVSSSSKLPEVPATEQKLQDLDAASKQQTHILHDAAENAPASAVNASNLSVAGAAAVAAEQIQCSTEATVGAEVRAARDEAVVSQPPDRLVFISVPGQHSRKPHLGQLLVPYVSKHQLITQQQQQQQQQQQHVATTAETGSEPTLQLSTNSADDLLRVELFARELFPGWMSWGNEVLKFQTMEYWDSKQ